jgi:hypothetical protein
VHLRRRQALPDSIIRGIRLAPVAGARRTQNPAGVCAARPGQGGIEGDGLQQVCPEKSTKAAGAGGEST